LFRPVILGALAILIAGLAAVGSDGHATRVSAASTINLFVGGGQGTIAVQTFRPQSVIIHEGDTVKWTNPYGEIHTVSFYPAGQPLPNLIVNGDINPDIALGSGPTTLDPKKASNSGVMLEDDVYSLTFPTSGIYSYFCFIHPGMVGTIQVVPAGSNAASTQSNITNQAKADLDAGIAAGQASVAATKPTSFKNANGSTTYENLIPANVQGGLVNMYQFVDPSMNIKVGDTVKWVNNTDVPHTVTFGIEKAGPDFKGPFVPTTAPAGSTYDGSTLVNSGIYSADFPGAVGPTFSLTFTKAGTYAYICLLHADLGMAGVVNVSAAGGAGGITPPSTGDAGLLGQSSGSWMMYAGFALLVVSIAGSVFVYARKES
jgi:plastocyanin